MDEVTRTPDRTIAEGLPPDADLCLTTTRLRLVPLVSADAEDLWPVLDDVRLHEFIGGAPPGLAELRSRFARWQARMAPDGTQLWLNWTVRLLAGDAAAGYVQATVTESEATVAYVIGTSWSGRGLAAEAVAGMVRLLRDRLGVRRIVAHIHPEHAASAGVARHAGLAPTGAVDEDGEQVWAAELRPGGGSAAYALRLSEVERARYRAIAERARTEEADLWRMAGIVEGARVADLGCGPGAVLVVMAERVGPGGQVTGVDSDPEAVADARAAIAAARLGNADVRLGDAAVTGLDPGSMDVAVLRLVLAHNGPAEQALVDHAAALVRPGGCVYLLDIDATMNRFRPPHPVLVEMAGRHHAFQAARGNDLQAGLRLDDLLAAAGLEVLDHRGRITMVTRGPGWRPVAWAAREAMVAAGFADASDLARWETTLLELDRGEVPLRSVMATFVAVGRRR